MTLPTGRPEKLLKAIKDAFDGRQIWPKASSDPERHYQYMGVTFRYIVEGSDGFVLTDLGNREAMNS